MERRCVLGVPSLLVLCLLCFTTADDAVKKVEPKNFVTPDAPDTCYFADAFPSTTGIGTKWILSQAKKEGVDEDIAKYNGLWSVGLPDEVFLKNDYGLIVKSKARHHAIAAKLRRPFVFSDVPLVMQYDVKFQNGQDCGGSYVKLLTRNGGLDLKHFHDKTPFTIMFGPDKCGIESKVHFIVRFKNPVTSKVTEHVAKQPEKGLDSYFTDKRTHLWTLVLLTDGNYRIFVDQNELMRGNLLDLKPSILAPKQIEDPNDKKPEDWDENEKIPDPQSRKPDDWDETIPEFIDDANAVKPADWLEEESEYVPSNADKKPEDWDEEMDGEWEPPRIKNPKCETASGCGKWTPPKVKNPAYKGKWTPPMIPNPNYKGKWKPRMIDNPEYFEVDSIFSSLEPIAAIGLELWTMTDGIFFDDFLLIDDKRAADDFASKTWYIKQSTEDQVASNNQSFFGNLIQVANNRPWLWAVYLLVVLIPLVIITIFCCGSSKDEAAIAKKTDKPLPDVQESAMEEEKQEENQLSESHAADEQESEAAEESPEPPAELATEKVEPSSDATDIDAATSSPRHRVRKQD